MPRHKCPECRKDVQFNSHGWTAYQCEECRAIVSPEDLESFKHNEIIAEGGITPEDPYG